jgi:CBS domain containing-hemolysin-like protein
VISILTVAGLTLLASFLCSLFEAALYSISPSQVELLRERKVRGAELLHRLREEVEEPIAAILTINTVAHTVGAAWCGAMVGEHFGSAAVGVFAAVFTLLVLAVTEIVPKSIGVRYARELGPWVARPIQIMIWSIWPFVWIVKRVMAILAGSADRRTPSEDEVLVLSRLAARGGAVRAEEHRWVRNALRLDRVTAKELRTPRTVVETLDGGTPLDEIVTNVESWVHSRVPVTDGDHADEVIGMVHRRDILDAALGRPGESLVVRDLLRPIRFVPECMAGHDLLDLFIDERSHMVAVADEYGGFEGIVTLEDVLEYLLGAQIVDEHDKFEDMQALAFERNRNPARAAGDTREGDRPSGSRP